ncbi:MAG: hypothetical protein ACFCUU_03030 [Cyclobacteriaceae bacterium]
MITFRSISNFLPFVALLLFTLDAVGQVSKTVELPAFEVQPNKANFYKIGGTDFFAGKKDRYIFKPISGVPSGFDFPESGEVAWFPTAKEFEVLREKPITILFEAISRENNEIIEGRFKLRSSTANGGVAGAAPTDSVSEPAENIEASKPKVEAQARVRSIDDTLRIVLPDFEGWNRVDEGKSFSFKLDASGGSGNYLFSAESTEKTNFNLETKGYFQWEPGYDFVKSNQKTRTIGIRFSVKDTEGRQDARSVVLTVNNTNRAPEVNDLPTFFLRYERDNIYKLKVDRLIFDPDGDEITFRPVLATLPQGMSISKDGEVKWRPSYRQFSGLRNQPIEVEFLVEDIHGATTSGSLHIEVTQEDLPPQITMVPNVDTVRIKENEQLNFSFFLTDPNGDDDIALFDFISDNKDIDHASLIKITPTNYEFRWVPGFNFVLEKGGSKSFTITFYAVDHGNHRTSRRIFVRVSDTENIEELDRLAYLQYRTILAVGWDLIEQLNEKEKEVRREYRKARNGRKNRAIVNASLGGLTGLSPVFLEGNDQRITSGIGGTATATLGTLEASNVIGRSPTELMQQWNYLATKRNDILVYGNVFSSKYAQKEERRKGSFQNDLNNLTMQMTIQEAHKIELDATWVNPKDASDKNIQRTFKDFYPDSNIKID